MSDDDVDDFLAHHGIKGMHWGIRKAEPTSSRATSEKKTSYPTVSEHIIKTELHKKVKAGGTKALTNQELRTMMERMQLEQSYKGLDHRSKVSGEDKAKRLLAIVGTANAIYAITKSPLGTAIKDVIEKGITIAIKKVVYVV